MSSNALSTEALPEPLMPVMITSSVLLPAARGARRRRGPSGDELGFDDFAFSRTGIASNRTTRRNLRSTLYKTLRAWQLRLGPQMISTSPSSCELMPHNQV